MKNVRCVEHFGVAWIGRVRFLCCSGRQEVKDFFALQFFREENMGLGRGTKVGLIRPDAVLSTP